METWWKLNRQAYRWQPLIEKIEVQRETPKCLFLKDGSRVLKEAYGQFFKSFDAAKDCAALRGANKIISLKSQLISAESDLAAIKSMEEPK